MSRYSRHIILEDIGIDGQNKLNQAKVLVIGAGGLGCPVLQYLAAAGIGHIGIIDFDIVEESNLQRQILYGTSNLGQQKAIAAKQRLTDLNSTIVVDAFTEALTPQNALAYFSNYDIIVDGTDNFETRYLINDAAILTNKPVVYGAIYKFEGQVSVFNYNNGPSYRCLFPNSPSKNDIPNCSEVGVLGVLPGIIGTMQANEVIKIILGFKNVLSGKLYCYNSKTTQTFTIDIKKSTTEFEKIKSKRDHFEKQHYTKTCDSTVKEMTIDKALQKENILFIDVRELDELPKANRLQHIKIPLSTLNHELHNIDKTKTIMMFCKSGTRSKKAVSMLQEHNITNCYSIKNGITAIENYFKIHA
ncbi:HesA/MoeB/ThiF family protein [Psychroserpens luteolus]|uniref:HesA/MoeB/ThiF family protein n=1 Tax=Psychroserpens luteolus TaxID=2855840 RepID=UPI001E2EFDDF|nr:HesA/MoeB/ThiF family protein [Psychroserpens luteolus]MCD2257739.1 HesA/MoeB/ThiF family protein [Psychroserpens luteolus]